MSQNYQIFKEWPHQSEYDQHDIAIFLRKAYWDLQLTECQAFPICMRNSHGDLIAFCCFAQLENSWKSPYFAPHSRIFSTSEAAFKIFIQKAFDWLYQIKAVPVNIILPTNHPNLLRLAQDTIIERVAISHQLHVSSATSFIELIKRKNKVQALKKLQEQAFTVTEISATDYVYYYEVLHNWRLHKGHKSPIPLEKFIALKKSFPDRYYFMKVEKEQQLLGLSIFIQEDSKTIYTYIVLDNHQNAVEEINLLLWDNIYETAKKLKVTTIDLGTSMLEGKINKGLARYKNAIGGQIQRKYSLKCLK